MIISFRRLFANQDLGGFGNWRRLRLDGQQSRDTYDAGPFCRSFAVVRNWKSSEPES